MFNNYNPYYMQPQRYQPNDTMNQSLNTTTYIPPQNHQNMQQFGLLGKSVDSIDVVKAMDIPLDGSVSYFPLVDGSAIVTKRIQTDGTSKTIVYKPVDDNSNDGNKYITLDFLEDKLKEINNNSDVKSFKEELKNIKKQIKEIKLEINDKED